MNEEIQALSLLEFNNYIKTTIEKAILRQWVIGEISEIHSAQNGHYYLELVEKSANNGNLVAKLRCTIWSTVASQIVPMFESATEQELQPGLKIMVFISAQYHEVYGLSGNITAINPTFTIGELERHKREIISRLMSEGVIDMNKSIPMPSVIQNVAIISAATAAGYGDFCNQIKNNVFGFDIHLQLYEAAMQGTTAEKSIIEALDKIIETNEAYDVVVIIRGGGSRSDLACFDEYDIANNVAQFPIPIITGIGHERDNSIVDMVAHTRQKTPTAVAEFIVTHNAEFLQKLESYESEIQKIAFDAVEREKYELNNIKMQLLNLSQNIILTNLNKCDKLLHTINVNSKMYVNKHQSNTTYLTEKIKAIIKSKIEHENNRIDFLSKSIEANNPKEILGRGYTITTVNNKRIKNTSSTHKGDEITTFTIDGQIKSIVE